MAVRDWVVVFLFRKMFAHAGERKKWIWLVVGLNVIVQVLNGIIPLLIGLAINKAQEIGLSQQTLPILLFHVGLVAGVPIISWMIHATTRLIEQKNSFHINYNYQSYLLGGLLQFPLGWHNENHSGDTLDKVNRSSAGLNAFAGSTFILFSMFISATVSIISLAIFNVHSLYIIAIFAAIIITTVVKIDKILIPRYKEQNKKYNFVSSRIFDTINNVTTIIILRIRHAIFRNLQKSMMEPYELYIKNTRLQELKWFIVGVLNNLMVFSVVGSYLIMTLAKDEPLLFGTMAALFAYVTQISHSVYQFAYSYGSYIRYKTDIQNAEKIEDEFKKLQEYKQVPLKDWKQISVRNLEFSYENIEEKQTTQVRTKEDTKKNGKKTPHLKGINIDIKHNQKIAFIGHSGSGKTTMLKLIRELFPADHIEVRLDDQPLPDGFANISSSIALIPQDPEIFNTTITENITIGIKKPLSEIRKYARIAKFDDIAMRLPQKYDSDIKEKGVNLSGGEKQRLALTRGLLASKDKEIILLDEPTSSIDTQNELDIFENIFKEFRKKTIIASVHRLHLLPLFDQIYFFKDGRIIASGSYEALKADSKAFQSLLEKYEKASRKMSHS